MFRSIHISTFDRMIVDIRQLLAHNRFTVNALWMISFFPDLGNGFLFMHTLEER